MNKINLELFDHFTLSQTTSISIHSQTDSLGTSIAKNLLSKNANSYDQCFVCGLNKNLKNDYNEILNEKNIFDDENSINKFINTLIGSKYDKFHSLWNSQKNKIDDFKNNFEKILIVLENMEIFKKMWKHRNFKKLLLNGRVFRISIIYVNPFSLMMSTISLWKQNIDNVMILDFPSKIDKIYDDFILNKVQGIQSLNHFQIITNNLTKNKMALVIQKHLQRRFNIEKSKRVDRVFKCPIFLKNKNEKIYNNQDFNNTTIEFDHK